MANPAVEPVYVELTQPHVHPRFGKMSEGRVVPVSPDEATRWKAAGIAKDSNERAYKKFKEERTTTGDKRVAALQAMNAEDSAMWDTNYRDAVMADPDKLQAAMDRGVLPTNLSALVDDDGVALNSEASFEDIMNARENLQHPDAGIDAHTSSSTSGNRSHYTEPVPERQRAQETMSTDRPPNRRVGRIARSQVANAAEEPHPTADRAHSTTGDSLGNVTNT